MKNYEKETKEHYKDLKVAESYHRAYNEKINLKNFRAQLVAKREKKTVDRFMERVGPQKVLDIPAGTGKLLPIFKKYKVASYCCDISEDMLNFARKEAERIQYDPVDFFVCDAERIREKFPEQVFDLAVCLRLLHRVPSDVKRNVLAELSQKSQYCIVSFGLDSGYYSFRRKIKKKLFKSGTGKLGAEKKKNIIKMLKENNFEIIDQKLVLPLFSQEVVFLVKSKLYFLQGDAEIHS